LRLHINAISRLTFQRNGVRLKGYEAVMPLEGSRNQRLARANLLWVKPMETDNEEVDFDVDDLLAGTNQQRAEIVP
jgi:hypothetical protein